MRRTKGGKFGDDSARISFSSDVGFEADSLARYNSLLQRISELEAEEIHICARKYEAEYRTLLAEVELNKGKIHENHLQVSECQKLVDKIEHNFDFLGKKHKDKRLQTYREKLIESEKREREHLEWANLMAQRLCQIKRLLLECKRKAKELDYVRQCETDLVDHVFCGQDAEDSQHDAFEQAVSSLAPRALALRQQQSACEVKKVRYEAAARHLWDAADALERGFLSPQKALREAFGEADNNLQQRPARPSRCDDSRASVLLRADRLIQSSVVNLDSIARWGINEQPSSDEDVKKLQPRFSDSEVQSIKNLLEPLKSSAANLYTPEAEKLAEHAIYVLASRERQARRAASESDYLIEAAKGELQNLETMRTDMRKRLEDHRRDLLHERLPLHAMGRAQSAPLARAPSALTVYTEEEFENYSARHRTNSNSTLSSLGENTVSYGSDMSRLDSNMSLRSHF